MLRTDDVFYRLVIVVILQHHLMHFENGCVCLPDLPERFVVQLLQLVHGFIPCILITGNLCFLVLDLLALYLLFIFFVNTDLTHRDPAKNTFSFKYLHSCSPTGLLS